MQNQIKYFYNIEINNIRQKNNNYYINNNFLLVKTLLEKINNYSINNNSYKVIKNKFNEYYSEINNSIYVLIMYNIDNRELNINDLNNLIYIKEDVINWDVKWSNKIDYIEYYMSNNYNKNNIYFDNMHYYIGLAENAIQLCKNIKEKLYIQHFRTLYKQDLYEHLSINNIIIDTKIRDICEYIKSSFFNNEVIYPNLVLNDNEKKLFLSRLLYPSYYFDEYKENEKLDLNQINKYIDKSNEYENYIIELCKIYNINIEIEWLKKEAN